MARVEEEDEYESDVEEIHAGSMDKSWNSVGPVREAEERMKREGRGADSSAEGWER